MIFKDLENLKLYLIKDSKQVSLNPVRFISVDSLSMWIEVKKILLSISDESLTLSKFCETEDTTPNIGRMLSYIKKSESSLFISPLSEYLRIKPEIAEDVICKIIKADYQNNESGYSRFYFLMYRIKSVLKTIPMDDPRTQNTIIYLETDGESDYQLTIIQKDLNIRLPGNTIFGFKSYLEYWEANPDKPLILHTSNAVHFENNHFFDDVHVIVSSFDLLKDRYDIPNVLQEKMGTTTQWNELSKTVVEDGSFESACCSLLSINRYSKLLFERWNNYTEFQKWLAWLWSIVQNDNSYVIDCARISDNVHAFIDNIYTHIILYLGTDEYEINYLERKKIIKALKIAPPESFWLEIKNIDDEKAVACLTDSSDIERKTVFKFISKIRFEDRLNVMPILKMVYPQLYYYLNNEDNRNMAGLSIRFYDYFQEYKWLKATDTITSSFMEKVKNIAKERGGDVFSMPTRNSFVTENYNENSLILFVDGMGIEYVDYLAYIFSELSEDEYIVHFEAGYCSLPSITDINKDFMNGRNTIEPPIRDLDELKHANNTYPESLIKQFRILDDIKERVIGALSEKINRIIVAADHGTSRLAVKVRETEFDNVIPKPEGIKIYKYGRFCEESLDEKDYPTAISINESLIFADYSRFVQTGAPIDEIHGGASLEEWIVPIIIIDKIGNEKKESIEIKPEKESYKPELGTKIIDVSFFISGKQRKKVKVSINGEYISCNYLEGKYQFKYKVKNNENSLTVKIIDETIIGKFDIIIEHPIKKNTKFDI